MTMRQTALELRAHGFPREADGVLATAIDWYARHARSDSATLGFRFARARTLFLADDRTPARAAYRALLDSLPRCLDCAGMLGVLAARDGNRREADSVSRVLAGDSRPYLYGRPLMWQARIASALGESARAANLVRAAFVAGFEFDVLTHADPDLARVNPDSIFRRLVRAP
jgi:hypothetical protein